MTPIALQPLLQAHSSSTRTHYHWMWREQWYDAANQVILSLGHDVGVRINIAYYLEKQFLKVAKARKRTIVIGASYLTFLSLGINIFGLDHPTSNIRPDIDSCLDIRMVARLEMVFALSLRAITRLFSSPTLSTLWFTTDVIGS